jgi:hypothetical protein
MYTLANSDLLANLTHQKPSQPIQNCSTKVAASCKGYQDQHARIYMLLENASVSFFFFFAGKK